MQPAHTIRPIHSEQQAYRGFRREDPLPASLGLNPSRTFLGKLTPCRYLQLDSVGPYTLRIVIV